jgi:hypothetical protein
MMKNSFFDVTYNFKSKNEKELEKNLNEKFSKIINAGLEKGSFTFGEFQEKLHTIRIV